MPDPTVRRPSTDDTHATGAALEAYGRAAPTAPHLNWTPQQIEAWKAQKRRTAAGKTWVKVGVEEMSVFAYPGVKDMVMVTSSPCCPA